MSNFLPAQNHPTAWPFSSQQISFPTGKPPQYSINMRLTCKAFSYQRSGEKLTSPWIGLSSKSTRKEDISIQIYRKYKYLFSSLKTQSIIPISSWHSQFRKKIVFCLEKNYHKNVSSRMDSSSLFIVCIFYTKEAFAPKQSPWLENLQFQSLTGIKRKRNYQWNCTTFCCN